MKRLFLVQMLSMSFLAGWSQSKLLFDDDWKFFLGDEPRASSPVFDDHAWRDLDLVHDVAGYNF
jgi:beta-galactosidase